MRIVLPVVAGIGNAIMTVPLARELGRLGELTVEAGSAAIGEVFARLPEVARVERLCGLRSHRRLRADVLVVPFPSNRWQYVALAATARARRVVMHDYPCGGWTTGRRFLRRATLVPAVRGTHDVGQNLRLVSGVACDARPPRASQATPLTPTFPLNQAERDHADAVTNAHGAVVVQAGCGRTVAGAAKRLPPETWAAVIDGLADRKVALIEGPDEPGVGDAIAALCKRPPPVVRLGGTLGESAAILERAACFVGVDSGLAHVAAAVGTPAVTAFAAADPDRVCPHGLRHLVVTPGAGWTPRLLYPMDATRPRLRADGVDWASCIRPGDLIDAARRALG